MLPPQGNPRLVSHLEATLARHGRTTLTVLLSEASAPVYIFTSPHPTLPSPPPPHFTLPLSSQPIREGL